MIITRYPSSMQVNEEDTKCNICEDILLKEVRTERRFRRECSECSYDDRPFGMCRSNRGPCTCEWKTEDVLYITCIACKEKDLIKQKEKERKKAEEVRRKAEEVRRKEFSCKWKTTSPQDKLKLHGIKKLKLLAKHKGIRKRSQCTKYELIELLRPVVVETDFPITDGPLVHIS